MSEAFRLLGGFSLTPAGDWPALPVDKCVDIMDVNYVIVVGVAL